MLSQAIARRDEARNRLDDAIQRAYQHVLYLEQPDPTVERRVSQRFLEQGTLKGKAIWEELAVAQKTFRPGAFDATALLHNLRDSDYQRPLSELRDAFWNTPRLSLLPGGDSDLRQAIYQAVREGRLRIVRAGGETVVVNDPSEINFNAPTYRLAKPEAATEPSSGARPGTKGGGQGGTDGHAAGGSDQGESGQDRPSPMERMFAITIMKNLASDPDAADNLAQLFRRLFDLLDRRDISYLQATLQAQLPPEQADEIAELARSLGFPATIRDR